MTSVTLRPPREKRLVAREGGGGVEDGADDGLGVVADLAGLHAGEAHLQVERADEEGGAPVEVDGALVGARHRAPLLHAADLVVADHQADGLAPAAPDRDLRGGRIDGGVEEEAAPELELAASGPSPRRRLDRALAEQVHLARGEGPLVGGASQVRGQDLRVLRVEADALVARVQQQAGLADEELVQRVLVGDEDGEAVAGAAPGAARLLPEGGAGAGIAVDDHRVEAADVDAELHRVRRAEAEELALEELLLDGSAAPWACSPRGSSRWPRA